MGAPVPIQIWPNYFKGQGFVSGGGFPPQTAAFHHASMVLPLPVVQANISYY